MNRNDDPFNPEAHLGTCSCGRHHSQAAHEASAHDASGKNAAVPQGFSNKVEASPTTSIDDGDGGQGTRRALETAVMRAIFPRDDERRAFLRAVGRNTAAAVLSQLIPFGALEAMAQEPSGPLEKPDLKIGYLPITCASPILIAQQNGYFSDAGLKVELFKTPGWALVRDKTANRDFDAAQMLAPMPLAMSMGAGSNAVPTVAALMDNVNGSAITLAMRHKDRRDPKQWKGFRLAIPFEFSIHNFLLREYLAAHGLDPDRDVQLRVMAPPDMLANLAGGNLDGFIVAEPFNQRAVYEGIGFIHTLSVDMWRGHPCCTFAMGADFARSRPNTYAALVRAMLRSAAYLNVPANRSAIVDTLAQPKFLNQPKIVVQQVLTGTYADGLGQVRSEPQRIGFQPFPWPSMAVWILAEMKRWGYVKADVGYRDIAERVYRASDARTAMKKAGMQAPSGDMQNYGILGRDFDPRHPEAYLRAVGAKV